MPNPHLRLNPKLAAFDPKLIIFDKDGTLIDFHAMWGCWITELAHRLETATHRPIADPLFTAMGFNSNTRQVLPGGQLADAPMVELRLITIDTLRSAGLSSQTIETTMAAAWHVPDPVALARPLTNISALFTTIQSYGAKIAVATSDDRAPTTTLLSAWDIAAMVDALVCADDGVAIKPAPDMVLTVCDRLSISPANCVMIGDNPADLQMGRAAGVDLTIGVLSGIGNATDLQTNADMLLSSVEELTVLI